jgi:plastocyanin
VCGRSRLPLGRGPTIGFLFSNVTDRMPIHRPRFLGWVAAAAPWLALVAAPGAAAPLEIAVSDERGGPVSGVAVFLTPATPAAGADVSSAEAVMDQRDQRFDPHTLVVRKGTSVLFPNSDVVSHHVYSFSPTKPFELGLYKGSVYPPVLFDKAGLVVVGCNIHDGMLGYILVVDTPYFSLSDDRGVARLDVPPGDYSLEVWTARARPAGLPARHTISVDGARDNGVEVRVTGRLAPAHGAVASSLSWRHY